MSERTSFLPRGLSLAAVLLLITCLFTSSSVHAASVDEKTLLKEMVFVEKIAKAGYFEAASFARDKAKTLPGLTEAQITFLDLVQAKIDSQEILDNKDLEERKVRLSKSIEFLNSLVAKLPQGSILRVQAGAKLIMMYVTVADGYVTEIGDLELDILGKVQQDVSSFKTRQQELAGMAQEAYSKAAEGADPVRREMLGIFDNLIDRMGMIEDAKRMQVYLKQLEVIFVAMEEFDHAVAAMFANWGQTYPRGSNERKEKFEKGYWYNMDVSEVHKDAYQELPDYVDYNRVMTNIRLGSLMDQPYALLIPAVAGAPAGETQEITEDLSAIIPSPLDLMSKSFTEEVVGKNARREVEVGQEARPRCLYYFGLGWLEMARGAYLLLDAETDEGKRKVLNEYAEKMIVNCEKVLEEFDAEKSLVGPIPPFVKESVEMDLHIPFLLLQAQRQFKNKSVEGAKTHLAYAKGVVGNMLLDPDPVRKQAAQRRMVVIRSVINELAPELNNERTPAEAIFEAERIHKAYLAAKARKAPEKDTQEMLSTMREKFMEAKTLLAKSKLPRKVLAEYGSKCWYYIGLASLYLGDYYEAFIANQHILQKYREKWYPASQFPQLERYRGFAARNVVTSAYKQHNVSNENFDRALYADSLIWRLSYESSAPSADGTSKENTDFYYVVGEQFLKSKLFEKAIDWFGKVPEKSKLYRLAWLQRGQANLKKALSYEDEAKELEKKAARISKTQPEASLEMMAEASALRMESKPWYQAAAESSQRFISEHEKYAALFADGKQEMPLHQKLVFDQEAQNKFAGYLLLMQVEFGAGNWDAVLAWAERLTENSVPESMQAAVLPVSTLMHFLSIINKLDLQKDPVDHLAAQLDKADSVRVMIGKHADPEDPAAIQAIMIQGDSWLKLVNRVADDPEKAKAYRIKAGNAFVEAIKVVDTNVNFAIVIGPIFTEQGLFDKAEEIYDRALAQWDTEEKRLVMPPKEELEQAVKSINAKYLGANEAQAITEYHSELFTMIYPEDATEQPNDLAAIAKINEIVAEAKKINVPGVAELPTKVLLEKYKAAIRFRNTMLRVKSGLILAKVDSEKWDEAMALVEQVLKVSPGDKRIQYLKATVHVRRAEKAGSLANANADLGLGIKLVSTLSFSKKKNDRFVKFSSEWWDSMALYYEANRVKFLYEPARAEAKNKIPLDMNSIRMWQGGRPKPTESFLERSGDVFSRYEAAGFKKKSLDKVALDSLEASSAAGKAKFERKNREAEDLAKKKRALMMDYLVDPEKSSAQDRKVYFTEMKEDKPDDYAAYWAEYPQKMSEWGFPKPIEEKPAEETPASGVSPVVAPSTETGGEAKTSEDKVTKE